MAVIRAVLMFAVGAVILVEVIGYLWHRFMQQLIKRHDIHHFARSNYGIVFFGIDRLFGTLRDEFPTEKQNIFS